MSRCDGKVIIIDTGNENILLIILYSYMQLIGISPAYGGVLSALSITYTLAPLGEKRLDPVRRLHGEHGVGAVEALARLEEGTHG